MGKAGTIVGGGVFGTTMLRTILLLAFSTAARAILLEGAALTSTVLNGALNTAAAPAAASYNFHNIHSMPAPLRAQAAALLMSSTPVLVQSMRQQLAQTAVQTAQAAQNMLTLSMSDDEQGLMAMDGPGAHEQDADAAQTGSAAMIGAAAAALALVNMRR